MRRALVAAAVTLGLASAASAGPNPPKFTRNPTVIVRHDDAMPPSCTLQDFVVATAKQPPLVSRPPVTASCPDRRRRQQ